MTEERDYAFPIVSINRDEYDAVQSWIGSHRALIEGKRLYIFGSGIRGCMILKMLEEERISVAGFCDNSSEKQGGFIYRYRIFNPPDLFPYKDENYFLVSPENATDIEVQLRAEGYEEEKNYSVIKNRTYLLYQREFFRKENIEYILFGDCYFTELDVDDLIEPPMSEMVYDILGRNRTKILSIHGMCVPSFYHLMKVQLASGIRPRAVAFIVNIPFCDGVQTKLPQSQHAKLLRQIRDGLQTGSVEFDQYVELAEKRSRNINIRGFSTRAVDGRNEEHIERLLTRSRYMYTLREENENIVYLGKMLTLLMENEIKAIPFFPALNYYAGVDYFGQEFIEKYCAICEGIKEYVNQFGVEILDMSFMLEKKYFTGHRMTKFPNRAGREKEIMLLCEKISDQKP